MILDSGSELPSHADVCIVGAGPTGLALAFRCTGNGLSVMVLEAGADGARAMADPVEIGGGHHADTSLVAWRGVGGTSRLWGGRCVAFDDIDFQERSHVPFSNWPISHADIAGYYGDALGFLDCGNTHPETLPEIAAPGSGISTTGVEIWSREPDLARVHGDRLRGSPAISICTGCTARSVVLDPAGRQVTAISVQRGHDVVEVSAGAFVLAGGGLENARLLLATQRFWPDRFGGRDGPLGRYYTGHLTGYLAKVRLFDRGLAKVLRHARSEHGAYYRRRLSLEPETQTTHQLLNTAFWLDSLSISDPAHGSGALSLAYLTLSSLGLYTRLGRGLAPSLARLEPAPRQGHWSNVRSDPELLRGGVRVLSDYVRNRPGNKAYALVNPTNRYLLRYHAEQAPDADNRVRLSDGRGDVALPRLRVDYRFQPGDIDSVVRSHELLDDWLRRNELGCLEYLSEPHLRSKQVFDQALDGYHQIGLTRMSRDPREGVVDAECRVHDLSNLFVAGSSVFPTAGQANPTLLAVALAMRLGDHLARKRTGPEAVEPAVAPASSGHAAGSAER